MENKKEGILKQFWSKLKNFWNKLENFWSNLGTDVTYYEITDEGFQKEIDKRGVDEEFELTQQKTVQKKFYNLK